MKREAEANKEADTARRELIELKNQADQLVHETGKQLEEHKDKLSDEDREQIEAARKELEEKAKTDDKDAIQAALEDFGKKAQKLGEIIYAQAQQEQEGAAPAPDATAGESSDDEPVDADFEVKN